VTPMTRRKKKEPSQREKNKGRKTAKESTFVGTKKGSKGHRWPDFENPNT